jgi:riboflavin synthase
MFTGLIEDVGRVVGVQPGPAGCRIEIASALASGVGSGDSVAVNGVCLTMTPGPAGTLRADVGPETLRVTTLGSLRTGQPVNLERSMRADGRLGGHFVQGHVDATGTLAAIRPEGDATWLTVTYPSGLAPLLIPKGSVAVDGISLTIAGLRDGSFDVMIVPFTWRATNLPSVGVGDRVNLECDMIGKYVVRNLELGR